MKRYPGIMWEKCANRTPVMATRPGSTCEGNVGHHGRSDGRRTGKGRRQRQYEIRVPRKASSTPRLLSQTCLGTCGFDFPFSPILPCQPSAHESLRCFALRTMEDARASSIENASVCCRSSLEKFRPKCRLKVVHSRNHVSGRGDRGRRRRSRPESDMSRGTRRCVLMATTSRRGCRYSSRALPGQGTKEISHDGQVGMDP